MYKLLNLEDLKDKNLVYLIKYDLNQKMTNFKFNKKIKNVLKPLLVFKFYILKTKKILINYIT